MRDYSAQTPLDFIKKKSPNDIPYLESQLEEATVRNGKVIYDFVGSDTPNLEEIMRRLRGTKSGFKGGGSN